MPLLIYYRKDGAIVNHHLAPAAWGPEELKKKIEEYNTEHPERPAYSLEVEPGSLTEYLLGKSRLRPAAQMKQSRRPWTPWTLPGIA